MSELFCRLFQFIIFPLLGLCIGTGCAVFGAVLVIGKYSIAWELLRGMFK